MFGLFVDVIRSVHRYTQCRHRLSAANNSDIIHICDCFRHEREHERSIHDLASSFAAASSASHPPPRHVSSQLDNVSLPITANISVYYIKKV